MKYDWTSFQNGCDAWKIPVSELQRKQLAQYYELLCERNKQMNLTAITEFEQASVLHFLDSLALPYLYADAIPKKASLIDVGTGAGFPGLVLKIVCPAWQVTLLDAQQKRVRFLNEVITELGLTDVTTLHGRAEDLAKDPLHREQYDIACARAVSALRVLSEYLLPFVKKGGFACAYKTQDTQEELAEAEGAIGVLGGGAWACSDYVLPETEIKRRLVRIEKVRETPETYPRKAGIPEKRPL